MSDRAERACARSCNWHGSGTTNVKACQKNARQEHSSDMWKSPRASPDKNPLIPTDYCGHRSKKHSVLLSNPKPVSWNRPWSVEIRGRVECRIFTAAYQLKLHLIIKSARKSFGRAGLVRLPQRNVIENDSIQVLIKHCSQGFMKEWSPLVDKKSISSTFAPSYFFGDREAIAVLWWTPPGSS